MIEQGRPGHGPLQPDDPRFLGDYEVVGRLGAGGMGVVYLARGTNGRLVAVKVVHAAVADDPEFRSRFRDEVARARQVPPFCTAEVLDADPDAYRPYLVVEYVDGPTLGHEVRSKGPLSPSNLHGVAIGVATALAAIHGAGVIHRDLKPGNVLLAPGSPKVIDFGIARALEDTQSRLTRTGVYMGTVSYMAPERFDEPATPLTPAADIFAWGCVIAFAGTGNPPFDGGTPMATMAQIINGKPRLDGMPDGPLRQLVEEALATDPRRRPTAEQLLARLLNGRPAAAAPASGPSSTSGSSFTSAFSSLEHPTRLLGDPASPRPQRRRLVLGAVAAVVLAAAAVGGVIAATSSSSSSAEPVASPTTPSPTPTVEERDQPPINAVDVAEGTADYGPYFVHNMATGLCVDIPGEGPGQPNGPVLQDLCKKLTEDNQEFLFVPNGEDEDGNQLYWIRNTDDDMCLDVPGAEAVDAGTDVSEVQCFADDNQDYRLEKQLTSRGWDYYRLVNASSGLCLDVSGVGDGGQGARLTLTTCTSGDDHEWALVKKSEW
ncbi:serine/threonine protein kinase [Actinoplanes rectilineatus]|uniref:serine/threonine protein kinase n=1 Tax=Actinoplanes rectilineatus TaxID=113571 RepID=UPI000AF8EAF8|nr:serine/threonine protein kinase [Actinoplanes rectilineatus]